MISQTGQLRQWIGEGGGGGGKGIGDLVRERIFPQNLWW